MFFNIIGYSNGVVNVFFLFSCRAEASGGTSTGEFKPPHESDTESMAEYGDEGIYLN